LRLSLVSPSLVACQDHSARGNAAPSDKHRPRLSRQVRQQRKRADHNVAIDRDETQEFDPTREPRPDMQGGVWFTISLGRKDRKPKREG